MLHKGCGTWGPLGSGWQGHTCVKNIPRVGVEVFAKFGGDWSGGSHVKKGDSYKQSLLHTQLQKV